MKIKFDEKEYELVTDYSYNIEPTHFQANVIIKTTLDELIHDVTGVEEIIIATEEDEVVEECYGYTKRSAITIYDEQDSASVELVKPELEGD